MLIDFHTHLFPDKLAPRALGALSETSGIAPVTDGTAAGTEAVLRESGVDRAVVMHVATNPRQMANVNRFALELNGQGPFICFGSVHPDAPDALDEAARLKAAGLPGVKLHPDYQGFDADERRLWPLYDTLCQLGLTVCFHAGLDPFSPEHIHATPRMLASVAREFPKLRIICAHFGGFRCWDAVEEDLVGKDVFLDTSFCGGTLSPEQAGRIVSRHGAERILFGSDCPWQSPAVSHDFLLSLGLSDRELECIESGSAQRLLGINCKF